MTVRGFALGAGRVWLVVLATVVVVRLAGVEDGTVLVLLVGSLPLALLPAYPLALAFVVTRRWGTAAVAAAVATAHLLLVLPSLDAAPRPVGGTALRVVSANLYVLSQQQRAAGEVLRDLRPDVLVVTELDAEGLAGLRAGGALDGLPHELVRFDGRSETVGLFSRFPLTDQAVRRTGGRALPRATVVVGGQPLRLLAEHPLPPVGPLQGQWRTALTDLRRELQATGLPVVVAGDLNADRDHLLLRRILDDGARDVHDERGRGLVRTWPASFPLLDLDHVLVRDGQDARLGVADVAEAAVPGSDHLAVVADLRLLAR